MADLKNAKTWPSMYSCRFLKDGLVSYEDMGCGINLIKKETIDRMLNSFIGKPVIIKHMEVSPGNFEDVAVGYITRLYYNSQDAWHWCDFLIINDKAKELISNGYSVSCAYKVVKLGDGGEHHAIRYENEILEGEGEHLALVPNPRYEECGVPQLVLNSKGADYMDIMETMKRKAVEYVKTIKGYIAEGIPKAKAIEMVRSETTMSEQLWQTDVLARLNEGPYDKDRMEQRLKVLKESIKSMADTNPDKKEVEAEIRDLEERLKRHNEGIDRDDPKVKAMFEKEKKEHPEFPDEDVWKIVQDHVAKENARINKNGGKKMGIGERIKNALKDLLQIANEADETPEAKAEREKKEKEEQDRKNAEEQAAKEKAEKEEKERIEKENALKVRAKNCGLAENATEEEVVKKENEIKAENERKENERKAKEAEGLKHFNALNALRENGELGDGLHVTPGNTQEERLNRGKQLYGSKKKS